MLRIVLLELGQIHAVSNDLHLVLSYSHRAAADITPLRKSRGFPRADLLQTRHCADSSKDYWPKAVDEG
jgi:hypothetical protein